MKGRARNDKLIGGPEIQNADSVHVIVNELIGKEHCAPHFECFVALKHCVKHKVM